MTKPKNPYPFYFQVASAQAQCARCEDVSPVITYRRARHGQDYTEKRQVIEALSNIGWLVVGDKAYCSVCRRIGVGGT